ncbi:DUF4145 domain-containing protein [Streptomyces sp. YIM 132580]|uniref:DUF4145 domain-containing protein n=1 Tax=Streptomyces sp. YIM 132580 TaxID=2691958 RepID=UPI00136C9CAB|nr:DUF4145 domain-containing protein [Streptomyces sp. YIM 132580]MXG27148.1 DUF4145 domain-containing protein [Streptomyces sp. YIM 132580]
MASTICGWCGDRTHMTMVLDPYRLPEATWPSQLDDKPVWMTAFRCSSENCHRLSIGWSVLNRVNQLSSAKQLLPQSDLQWEPLSIRRPLFLEVPPEIAETASEAHACLSIGAARGAVALARSVVEATAKAQGITAHGIVAKIEALRDGGVISTLTAETSHQIRRDGNSIAHGDIGNEPVSVDDAQAIIEFMDALLDEVFQRPAKLQKLKERHNERKQSNGADTRSDGGAEPEASAGGVEMR